MNTAGYSNRRAKRSPWLCRLFCLWLLLCLSGTVWAQGDPAPMFAAADKIRARAEAVTAPLLSPEAFAEAEKLYADARRDAEAGRKPERVNERLDRSMAAFRLAETQAQAAAAFFSVTLASRNAASEAIAERLAERQWNDAEDRFRAAIKAHERGKLEPAQRDGVVATELYRTAELEAIRNLILSTARGTLADIRRNKLDKWVPTTLDRAEQLVQRADALIVADRSALDEPKALAAQAEAEARRALTIGELARRVDRDEASVEELVLRWQGVLENVAAAADVAAGPAAVPEDTALAIIEVLETVPGLRSDLADRDALVIDLEATIRELDQELGGAAADRTRLIRRLEEQERIREQFAQVENLFSPDEAVVLREGSNLIIRLVGMNFASNSAELSETGNELLDKVRTAIDVFPQCDLHVEGHTDSQGNAQRNMALSEQRALAVKTHMIDQLLIPAFRIEATGFGDTRPIASNRTAEGRARNRRIDLMIVPNAASF